MDVAGGIKPRKYFIHERLDLVVGATSAELRDPNRSTGCDLASVVDIVLEVRGVGCIIVPVQGQ